jgi:large subunit ribosomal protein L24
MKLKKNDNVKILTGKDQGKTGKILQMIKKTGAEEKVVVEGLNLRYKHARAKKQGESGQKIQFPAPINISNVQLVCPKCNKPTRVGYKLIEGKKETMREKKQRVCKKCKAII